MLREIAFMVTQHKYFNDNHSRSNILLELRKFAIINEENSLKIFKDITELNEIYIKQYMFYQNFLNSKNKFTNINMYLDNLYIQEND